MNDFHSSLDFTSWFFNCCKKKRKRMKKNSKTAQLRIEKFPSIVQDRNKVKWIFKQLKSFEFGLFGTEYERLKNQKKPLGALFELKSWIGKSSKELFTKSSPNSFFCGFNGKNLWVIKNFQRMRRFLFASSPN